MPARFRDGGETLAAFGDEILVRCPSCEGRAVVRPVPGDRGAATLSCLACGLARRVPEAKEGPSDRRCPRCDRWIPVSAWKPFGNTWRYVAACRRCGKVVRAARDVLTTVTGLPVYPYCREPLWLQAPVEGELLCAWNVRHLDFLAALVAAPLRERTPGRSGNGTLLSRLPRWMKAAKRRAAVLAAIDALRGPISPPSPPPPRRGRAAPAPPSRARRARASGR